MHLCRLKDAKFQGQILSKTKSYGMLLSTLHYKDKQLWIFAVVIAVKVSANRFTTEEFFE